MAGNWKGSSEETSNEKGNPFANAFECQGSDKLLIYDTRNRFMTNNNNNENSITNGDCNNNNNNSNNNKNNDKNDEIQNSNNNEVCRNGNSIIIQTNNKEIRQENDCTTPIKSTTISESSLTITKEITKPKTSTNNNSSHRQKRTSNPKPKANQTTLNPPNSSATNVKGVNKGVGASYQYSIHQNQNATSIKGKNSNSSNSGEKSRSSNVVMGRGKKSTAPVNSRKQQGVGRDRAGVRGGTTNKEKQGKPNPSVSIKDLENVLGVSVTELRDVIQKYKSEKIGDCSEKNDGKKIKKSQDGLENDKLNERKSDKTLDNNKGIMNLHLHDAVSKTLNSALQ